ncbi:MAG: HAD family phosphatase [Beijerinckiaceae bacterium]|nr:HAD family phosphatase [Beijerinckiaceae bacterium]MCZ8300987.1 HAD family phosphatase [Beijerinckiaceae bacterium]
MKPTNLVFDIGNVLIRWDSEIPYRRLIPDPEERRRFFTEILPPEWNLEQDRGRPWPVAEAERIALHPDKADLIRAFRHHWHEMVPGPIEANVAVLENALGRGIPCYAITNFAADTFAEARARFPFLDRFAGTIVSAELGVLKPDPAIYTAFLDRHGLEARACLFMDDSAKNVAGAAALGFATIHVTGTTDLANEIRHHGFDL